MGLKKAYDSVRKEVLYNILNEFDISMKPVRLINKRLNETYCTVRVGTHLSDKFPFKNVLKEVDTLLPLFFNFAVVYNRPDDLKLNGFHQHLIFLLICWVIVHIL
jgi:hypothetical protein